MAHDHSHGHDHHHHAAPASYDRAFALGIGLNLAFVAIEATFGLLAGSLALLADAGHNLSDVLGLALAWGAAWLARRQPTPRRTYGLRRSSILAALANAMLLILAIGAIAWEAVQRLQAPEPVATGIVFWVAGVGVLINGGTALLFMRGRENDLNIRGAFLHMAADAGITVGVMVSALLIAWTGWLWLDPVTSLAISAVILVGTWGLLREFGRSRPGRGAARHRPGRGRGLPGSTARGQRDPRSAHLGDEHHRDRADGPPGAARRPPRTMVCWPSCATNSPSGSRSRMPPSRWRRASPARRRRPTWCDRRRVKALRPPGARRPDGATSADGGP